MLWRAVRAAVRVTINDQSERAVSRIGSARSFHGIALHTNGSYAVCAHGAYVPGGVPRCSCISRGGISEAVMGSG